jgi:hypothetical protein
MRGVPRYAGVSGPIGLRKVKKRSKIVRTGGELARRPELCGATPLDYALSGPAGQLVIGVLGGRLFESQDFCHEHSGQIQVCTRSVDCSCGHCGTRCNRR